MKARSNGRVEITESFIERTYRRFAKVRSAALAAMWYLADTIHWMAMTLRLTEEEQAALRERAALEGTSMQEAARRAVREYIAQGDHRDRVAAAAELITQRHGIALQRLGE